MKILVCGSSGQLGSEIKALSVGSAHSFLFTDLDTLDITHIDAVRAIVALNHIEVILNCAAYTAVDRAQSDAELALKINAQGPAVLAQVALESGAALVHISTDYVFDGTKRTPYIESDPVAPLGVYGATKRRGEELVVASGCRGVIIRTSWLYSPYGSNFVLTMIRLAGQREVLSVVDDQWGTPTYAADLAAAMVAIAPQIGDRHGEIYHYSDMGQTTWARFAEQTLRLSGLDCRVEPITTEHYPTPTERPKYSVLSKDKIMKHFDLTIPTWESSLEECIKKIKI